MEGMHGWRKQSASTNFHLPHTKDSEGPSVGLDV